MDFGTLRNEQDTLTQTVYLVQSSVFQNINIQAEAGHILNHIWSNLGWKRDSFEM